MFCDKCGNGLQDGEIFCSNCGNRVSKTDTVKLSKEILLADEAQYQDNIARSRNHKEVYSKNELYKGNVILNSAEPFTDVAQWHYWLNLAVMLLAVPVEMLMGQGLRQALAVAVLTGFMMWAVTRMILVSFLYYRYEKICYYLPHPIKGQELEQVLHCILPTGEAAIKGVSNESVKVKYNGLIFDFTLEEDHFEVSWWLELGRMLIIGRGWRMCYIYRAVSTISYLVYGIQQELFRTDSENFKYYKNNLGVYQKVKPTKTNLVFKGLLVVMFLAVIIWVQIVNRNETQKQPDNSRVKIQENTTGTDSPQEEEHVAPIRDKYPDVSASEGDSSKAKGMIDYLALYQPVLSGLAQNGSEFLEYCLYDLDGDGVFELIAENEEVTGGYTADIYTIENGSCLYLSNEYVYYASFYVAEDGNGLFLSYGHMGYEYVYRLVKTGHQISVGEEWSIETGRLADYYSNNCKIDFYSLSDDTVLRNPSKAVLSEPVKIPDDYVLRTSSCRYLSEADLVGLTADGCRIARNEIYARYGRMFSDPTLQTYFNGKSWYLGMVEPDAFDDSILNEYERANLELIIRYETAQGYR